MRNYLYSLLIDDVTYLCYWNSLDFFPPHAKILDVGIGNGIMIEKFHDIIREKDLKITGIDINRSYLTHCSGLIREWGLEKNIEIFHAPVEHFQPPEDGYYDFILFSMSFMLFRDQGIVLDRTRTWIKPGGRILFFQTMFRTRSILLELIKPKLKYFTTIDFGRVTYERDFFALLKEKDLQIVEDRLIRKEWFKGEYRLFITTSVNGRDSTGENLLMSREKPREKTPTESVNLRSKQERNRSSFTHSDCHS
ncbi:MAG TPA: class I SAM-dependent methyltransferase [Deltaproteobacteria bacterium]|nr:class I SAM-dependent methyltransferase [Deltaproteobacteria bacterium]